MSVLTLTLDVKTRPALRRFLKGIFLVTTTTATAKAKEDTD